MDNIILEKASAWANNPYFDEESRTEIQMLIDNKDEKELTERFYKDLEFGTGGMRSILGAGNNRINTYNIRKASQALATEVINANPKMKKLGIAISYDSRKFSIEFAKEAAGVFSGNGINAYIFERMNPVAMVSYSVRHHEAQAGIMVTASHNPPEYNGYKVFWNDGAQVTPPNDKNIINHFNTISEYSTISYKDFDKGVEEGLIHWVGEDVENLYYDAIKSIAINPKLCKERGEELSIVYTPIHGTGLLPCTRALRDLGLTNYKVVEEQAQPDHRFPTVTSPNPENPSALALAVALMEKENADIVMGSDPDTDRLGVALKHDGIVKYLNGNQIGILMLHYMLTNLKEQNRMPTDPYFVKTIVTTPLQEKIAAEFGVKCENTLTGFKWICGLVNKIEREEPNRNFLFGTEESFGYLNHGFARDKDGISSVTLMAEMALWYKTQNLNLFDALDKIYEQYGFSHESLLCLNYYGKEGGEKIGRIMENFRAANLSEICGDKVSILEDFKFQKSLSFTDNLESKLDLPSSNVLGFNFENGNKVFLRPSGTEPKIKFYIMIQETEGSLEEKKEKALKKTEEILDFVKSESEKA